MEFENELDDAPPLLVPLDGDSSSLAVDPRYMFFWIDMFYLSHIRDEIGTTQM